MPENKQAESEMLEQQVPDMEAAIRVRAYELFEERGRADGQDLDDWLRAESEICGVETKAAAAD